MSITDHLTAALNALDNPDLSDDESRDRCRALIEEAREAVLLGRQNAAHMPAFDWLVNSHNPDHEYNLVILRDAEEGEQIAEVCALTNADAAQRCAEMLNGVLKQWVHLVVTHDSDKAVSAPHVVVALDSLKDLAPEDLTDAARQLEAVVTSLGISMLEDTLAALLTSAQIKSLAADFRQGQDDEAGVEYDECDACTEGNREGCEKCGGTGEIPVEEDGEWADYDDRANDNNEGPYGHD